MTRHGWTAAASFLLLLLADGASAIPLTGVSSQWFPPDARSQGFGRAFTAVADGPAAVWWNPGALAIEQGASVSPYAEFPILPAAEGLVLWSFSARGAWEGIGLGAHLSRLEHREFTATD